MRNIIVIITNLSGGGAERVATNLATCLSKYDNVTLVVEHIESNTYGSSVHTIDLHMPVNKGVFKVFWHLSLTRKLRKLKKELNITHSISFLSEPSLANVLSKRAEKVIVSERNFLSAKKSRILKCKESWLMQNSDYVVALSEMVRKDIIDNFKVNRDKVKTIYNPCYINKIREKSDEDILDDAEKIFYEENKDRIVISAGRLVDQKGHWHLIRAFQQVLNNVPDAKLLILGEGENRGYLQTLIDDLHLGDNVKLIGYKANPYVYLKRADLFAFPSIFEGLGNIIVECMACELPVISTDCKYGPKELLDPGSDYTIQSKELVYGQYGILTPPFDGNKYEAYDTLTREEKIFAQGIIELLSNKSLRDRYRKKIYERGYDFSPEVITKQWMDIL